MSLEISTLEPEHLTKLMNGAPASMAEIMARAYFSPGSAAYCLLVDGVPVFAGGIVNLEWHRGEAWILPTQFFREHWKTCFKIMKKMLPQIAAEKGFVRVQAVAVDGVSVALFKHMGFEYEAMLKHFGPLGEECKMYTRIFGNR